MKCAVKLYKVQLKSQISCAHQMAKYVTAHIDLDAFAWKWAVLLRQLNAC